MNNRKSWIAVGMVTSVAALVLGVPMDGANPAKWRLGPSTARAQSPCNPCAPKRRNPCNPCSGKRKNPCNPCAAKAKNPCNPCNPCAAKAKNPCNPCNPCAAKAKNPCNPCNPCAAKAKNPCNPCNPCAAKAKNPCNPCAAKNPCNPCAAKNPCNPCSAKRGGGAAKAIAWGKDYTLYARTTDYVDSASHGGRLVVTYVSPKRSAEIYRQNAKRVRQNKTDGYKSFPTGTVIVKESFVKEGSKPGKRGPVFFMRKENTGYDNAAGNWRYAFTEPDLKLIGEGKEGNVAFCRACHLAVKNRDFVYAVDQ